MQAVDSTSGGDRLYNLVLVVQQYEDGDWCCSLYDRSEGPLSLPVCEGFGESRPAALHDMLKSVRG